GSDGNGGGRGAGGSKREATRGGRAASSRAKAELSAAGAARRRAPSGRSASRSATRSSPPKASATRSNRTRAASGVAENASVGTTTGNSVPRTLPSRVDGSMVRRSERKAPAGSRKPKPDSSSSVATGSVPASGPEEEAGPAN